MLKVVQRDVWERMWAGRRDVRQVYDNGDRIPRNLSHVVDVTGKRVLEVGAGTGRDSAPLAEQGATVVQVDLARESLGILRHLRRASGRIHVLGADAFTLPFSDGTFDVVLHQGLLEHFLPERADALLHENIRVLAPDGLLLVDVPQRWHPYTLLKRVLIVLGRWFAGWERSFDVRQLRSVLERHGLEVQWVYGEWMYPSLVYRVVREAARRVGVSLPLSPRVGGGASRLRDRVRAALWRTPLPLYTGISIGVVARKPAAEALSGPHRAGGRRSA